MANIGNTIIPAQDQFEKPTSRSKPSRRNGHRKNKEPEKSAVSKQRHLKEPKTPKDDINEDEKAVVINSSGTSRQSAIKMAPVKAKSNKAYAFLLGGINSIPDDGSDQVLPSIGNNPNETVSAFAYRGLLYNILVAVKILRDSGSTADFVVLVHMVDPFAELPAEDVRWLTELEIRIIYVPPSPTPVNEFFTISVEKFRILDLVEYDRVLYMDADVTPHCNLDYIMDLSMGENPLLEPNFIMSVEGTPASASFFMLTPGKGFYDRIMRIVVLAADSYTFRMGPGWGPTKRASIDKDRPWRTVSKHYIPNCVKKTFSSSSMLMQT